MSSLVSYLLPSPAPLGAIASSAAPAAPAAPAVPQDPVGSVVENLFGTLTGEDVLTKAIFTMLIVVLMWGLRRIVLRTVASRVRDVRTQYHMSKGIGYATTIVGILWIGFLWFERIGSVGTFLGLMAAGLAIALRDLIAAFAGWLFILIESPFELGDRIQVGPHRGDVVDIRAFEFTILEIGNWVHADQSTGRLIHIPNADVFRVPVANSSTQFPYVWHEIPVAVTFESDWRRAKGLLLEIAEREGSGQVVGAEAALLARAKKFLIHYSKVTPTVYTSVVDSGVLLTIRYLADPRERRGTSERIWEAILDAFAREDEIDLAYPTRRVFSNLTEGKLPLRAPPGAVDDELGGAGEPPGRE